MDKTKLILMRHAEVKFSPKKFLGNKDVKLSKKGIEHAKGLAKKLKNEKIDVIYSSTLKRAIETADIVAEAHGLQVKAHVHELNEMNFGKIEGLTKEQAMEKYPEMMQERNGIKYSNEEKRMNFRVPEAETYNEVGARALIAIKKIVKENKGKNILIVTHHHVMRILAKLITMKSLDEIEKNKMDYCCRIIFEAASDKFVLKKIIESGVK